MNLRIGKQHHVVVAGAGGFIGGHLVAALLADGNRVRAVDVKPLDQWFQTFEHADNRCLDLRRIEACHESVAGVDEVFNLACDMGGMGFIEKNRAACMLSVLINAHLLAASQDERVESYFFASSACVYAAGKQNRAEVEPLREVDAYPAMPEDGYGWEKLFSERLCRHFMEDFGLETRVARYHNVFGPNGTWDGGREKAPAAICRKVAEARRSGQHEIEIWGDGGQTRSFMYVEDCIEGTLMIARADSPDPVNLGSDELVTINGLVDIVESIADITLERRYVLGAPQGVRGRNSDNTMIEGIYGWAPSISLRSGLERTFPWVDQQLGDKYGAELATAD
jgi:nucleoside-diphosphate-sugar epimerase